METAQVAPTTQTPTATAPAQATPPVVEQKPVDLVTRASAVKMEALKEVKEPEFDVNEISKIADPAAREYAEKAYKSFQRGFNQKFQEIAEIRKKFEAQEKENSQWTPQRVQSMLQDPNFVNAAKQVVATQNPQNSGLTDEQYSALSDAEKSRINQMESELVQLKQQNWQALRVQEDTVLKGKYANYAPDVVDTTVDSLVKGTVKATRESIWKYLDYDDAVKRAYELGKQDERGTKQDKINSMSYETGSVTPNREVPQKLPTESDRSFLQKLYMNALAKAGGK